MADSTNITIIKADWTLVVASGAKGLYTNPSNSQITVRKADTAPLATELVGHTLKAYESINADLTDAAETGSLYARITKVSNGETSAETIFTAA